MYICLSFPGESADYLLQSFQSNLGVTHLGKSDRLFSPEFWLDFWRSATVNGVHTAIRVVAVVIGYVILRAAMNQVVDSITRGMAARRGALGGADDKSGRLRTLTSLIKSVVAYVLIFVFGVTLLRAIGVDVLPFITTASVIALAVGFGSQKLVRDVISGIFIVVDGLFVVGDMVTIAGSTGRVVELSMRVTRLVDLAGRTIIIPNGDIGTVTNLSKQPVEEPVDISLGPHVDLASVRPVVVKALRELYDTAPEGLKRPPQLVGVWSFGLAATVLRIVVAADPSVLPTEQMRVREAVRAALISAEIPLG